MSYRINRRDYRTLKGFKSYTAETLEKKLQRVMTNGEAIKDKAPLVYTDRKDGVLPDFDIRTDKYEYLVEGYDKAAKSKRAKRDGIAKAEKDLDKQNADLAKNKGGSNAPGGSGGTEA
jgi:hypothetical protein